MKWLILAVVVLVFVGWAGSKIIGRPPGARPATSSPYVPPTAPTPVAPVESLSLAVNSADTIAGAYQDNELRADKDLKGKWCVVSGEVEKVGKDILGTPYVVLKSNGRLLVQCVFSDPAKAAGLASLNKGDTVYVAGVCSGKLGTVLFRRCQLVNPPASPDAKITIVPGE